MQTLTSCKGGTCINPEELFCLKVFILVAVPQLFVKHKNSFLLFSPKTQAPIAMKWVSLLYIS